MTRNTDKIMHYMQNFSKIKRKDWFLCVDFLCFNTTYSNISANWALEEVEVMYRIKYMYINNTSFSKIILDGLSAHNVLML
jgi:hypothetical protein